MANFNFNKVILGGRLTADPELRTTQSGIPVLSFSIAVNRKYQSRTTDDNGQPIQNPNQQTADFINCVAWRQQAEFISKYFRRGSSICVVGSLQVRSYNDQQGQKRTATDVQVDEVMFVDSRGEGSNAGQSYGVPQYGQQQNPFAQQSFGGQQSQWGQPAPQMPQYDSAPQFASQPDNAGNQPAGGQFEVISSDDDLPF